MKKRIVAGITTALLALGGTVAYASIPDSSGVIHGCRSNLLHTLAVIDSPSQSCGLGTTPLNWNQTGPEGPQGSPGAAGATGPGAIFYKVSDSQPLTIGQTSVSLSVPCSAPGDIMISGGYGFNQMGLPYPGSVAIPLTPAPQNLHVERSLMRRPGISPIAENYEFQASFDPWDGITAHTLGGASIDVRAICMTPTS